MQSMVFSHRCTASYFHLVPYIILPAVMRGTINYWDLKYVQVRKLSFTASFLITSVLRHGFEDNPLRFPFCAGRIQAIVTAIHAS